MRGRLKLTDADKRWAQKVKERDNNRCVICGTDFRLNSHHIIPRENHDMKYELVNGITLCAKHHMFCREISAHNNPLAFFIWMEQHRPDQLDILRNYIQCNQN